MYIHIQDYFQDLLKHLLLYFGTRSGKLNKGCPFTSLCVKNESKGTQSFVNTDKYLNIYHFHGICMEYFSPENTIFYLFFTFLTVHLPHRGRSPRCILCSTSLLSHCPDQGEEKNAKFISQNSFSGLQHPNQHLRVSIESQGHLGIDESTFFTVKFQY